MSRLEGPSNQLESGGTHDSIFVLFRLLSRLYNVICAGFQPLWG
jgi:hypothetical protein